MRIVPLLSIVLTAAPLFAAQDAAPTAYPFSRYEKMMGKSPFVLETPKVEAAPPKDNFTKDWVVTSINRLPIDVQGLEQDFVTIMTRDQTQRFTLTGNQPNTDGVSIASIEHSPLKGRSKVTLKKGEEFGTVGYDEMLMQQQAPAGNPGGNPQRPGFPGAQMAPGNQGLNTRMPMNNGRPMIPRPNLPVPGGSPQMNNNGAAPLPAAQPADARRRVRVINSK